MNMHEYIFYCLAVIVMIATPGPVMMLVASAGLKGGYSKALRTIFGTNFASLILIGFSVLLLKGVLTVNDSWLNIIKMLGCLYIVWLGAQILKDAVTQPQVEFTGNTVDGGFFQGFFVGISNPKDIIFFASFFPQFIQITPDLNQSLIILILSWIVLDFATLSVVYLMFNRLSRSRFYPHLLAVCGVVLILVAAFGLYSVRTLFAG